MNLKSGDILSGRYRILREIGRGAFGITFLAEDIQRPKNPQCVVKQFKPMASDPYTLRAGKVLFDREAETLEKLGKHNQIPQLLAFFSENQQFYLVQEYIAGHDLKHELSSGEKLSETVVIKLLQDILEVLDFVHEQKVIHRDIKPSNIRRRQSDGKVVLIDFGAVKEVTTQMINPKGQTYFTVAIGTPGYMPSEQSNGTPDFSSDVYAVGMIGIQALTGTSPIHLTKNRNSEIAWHHLTEVSTELTNILDQMVCYDFRQRYPNARLALQALKALKTQTDLQSTIPDTTTIPDPINSHSNPSQKVLQKFLIPGVIATGILGIGIAISATLNTPKTGSEAKKIEFTNYEKSELGIKIKYPQNWQRQDINNLFTQEVVTFVSPKQSQTDNFQEKLTISIRNYSGTLDNSKAVFTKEIINSSQGGNIINTSRTTVAYKPGYQLVFAGKYNPQDREQSLNLKNLQTWTLKGEKAYIMTYTAQEEDYDTFLQTAKDMINSFEFSSKQGMGNW